MGAGWAGRGAEGRACNTGCRVTVHDWLSCGTTRPQHTAHTHAPPTTMAEAVMSSDGLALHPEESCVRVYIFDHEGRVSIQCVCTGCARHPQRPRVAQARNRHQMLHPPRSPLRGCLTPHDTTQQPQHNAPPARACLERLDLVGVGCDHVGVRQRLRGAGGARQVGCLQHRAGGVLATRGCGRAGGSGEMGSRGLATSGRLQAGVPGPWGCLLYTSRRG